MNDVSITKQICPLLSFVLPACRDHGTTTNDGSTSVSLYHEDFEGQSDPKLLDPLDEEVSTLQKSLLTGRGGCYRWLGVLVVAFGGCANSLPPVDETVSSSTSGSGTDITNTTAGDDTATATVLDGITTIMEDTGSIECSGCPAEQPFCNANEQCVTCDEMPDPNGTCTSMDLATPLCEGGVCVQCTAGRAEECQGGTPVCDASNMCVPCTAHAQCASGACELAKGTCFPGDAKAVIHVDGDGGQDFLTVSMAVGSIRDGADGVIMVHELDGGVSYQESVVIDGGKMIALLAAPGEAPVLQGTAGDPGLTVEGTGTILHMDGLGISGGPVEGLVVTGAYAWVDRSRVVDNIGGGIVVEGSNAELTVRNSFVGVITNNVPAVALNSGVTATVSYSTIIGAFGTAATGLTCAADATLVARDTIILSLDSDSPVSCIPGTFEHVASDTMLPGRANFEVEDFSLGSDWFIDTDRDYHLQNEGLTLFADVAQWNDGDPLTDIDGEERAQPDGAPDYAGADVP